MERLHSSPYFLKVNSSLLCHGLPLSVRFVLAALVWHRNKATGQCNPRAATLAAELDIGARTVERAIAVLREAGIVTGKTRGQKAQSFQIAPESEWPVRLSHFRQNGGRCTPRTTAKMADVHPPKWRTSASVSITEQKRGKEEERSRRVVRSVVAQPTGGAAAPLPLSHSKTPNPERVAPRQASVEPAATAATDRLAEELVEALAPVHPTAGLARRAIPILQSLLRQSDAPESLAAQIRVSHATWLEYWNSTSQWVPMLWRWLQDGDWQYPPTDVAPKKAPAKALSFEEKVMAAAARVEARRMG